MRDEKDDKERQMEEQRVMAETTAMREKDRGHPLLTHLFKLEHSGGILFLIPFRHTDVIGDTRLVGAWPWKRFFFRREREKG